MNDFFFCKLLFAEIIEDATESPALSAPVNVVSPPTVEQEAYRKLGLTKQVLAAHTQKEEQAFLSRCRELRHGQSLRTDCSPSIQRNRAQGEGMVHAKTNIFSAPFLFNADELFLLKRPISLPYYVLFLVPIIECWCVH